LFITSHLQTPLRCVGSLLKNFITNKVYLYRLTIKTMRKMILKIPTELNEELLDEVAKCRKQGNRTSKEKIIISLIKKHYD